MEGVMKRQDPERNDLGDSSVVSDSVEIKCPLKKKKHKRKINRSNFESPGTYNTDITTHHFHLNRCDSKTPFKVSLTRGGFEH
jgi:hypothetical protein